MYFMNAESMLASFTFSGVMDSVADAMTDLESSDHSIVAPLRTSVMLENNTLMMMPCLTEKDWGLKVLTIFPDNPGKMKSFINGLFLFFDGDDGAPTALFDGRTLTAIRTGAVGGLAVRTLSDVRAARLGVVGAGEQGYWQARFACAARPFSLVTLYDTIETKAESCAKRLRIDLPDREIRIARNTSAILEDSDVVMTATNAATPLFEDRADLFKGKTIVGIGSYRPDMREYPDAIFKAVSAVFIDTEHAFDETGDLLEPLRSGVVRREGIRTLGSLLTDRMAASSTGSGAFFKSVGFSAFDLYVAKYLFHRGVQSGKGTDLAL